MKHVAIVISSLLLFASCKSEEKKPVNPQAGVKKPVDDGFDDALSGEDKINDSGADVPDQTTTPPPSGRTAADLVQTGDPTLWGKLTDAQKAALGGISEESFKAMTPEQVAALLQIQPGTTTGATGGAGGIGGTDINGVIQLIQNLIQQGGGVGDLGGDDFGGEDDFGGDDFGDFELRGSPTRAQ